jgi:hypothetical protein
MCQYAAVNLDRRLGGPLGLSGLCEEEKQIGSVRNQILIL